jgi:hypothetical protein
MLDKLTSADFQPFFEQTFHIRLESGDALKVVLIEVTELGSEQEWDGDSGRRKPFSLLFRGAMEPLLPQRIYRVEHPDMGALDIFLVPVGPDREGMCYEALFA